jgi:transcriptional regulator with GAF, ATPase, and Fis domain
MPAVLTIGEQDLRAAEAAVQSASVRADELRGERDRLVRAATQDGWSHARIARALGLTRGRVGQIATAGRGNHGE